MSSFNLDPEVINRYVAEQIAQSAIGDALKTAIDEQVKQLTKSYDNPMKHVVAQALAKAAREYLETPEVATQMRKVIEEALTETVLNDFIAKVLNAGFNR